LKKYAVLRAVAKTRGTWGKRKKSTTMKEKGKKVRPKKVESFFEKRGNGRDL